MTLSLIDTKNKSYQSHVNKAVSLFNDFFEIKLQTKPCLILVNNHQQFERIISKPMPNWLTGYNVYNLIFLLDPDNWEIESNHKYSDDKFITTLKHEICHIYFKKITGTYKPVWLNEGLSLYLSDQLKFRKEPDILDNFLQFTTDNTIGKHTVYEQSGFAVKKLCQKFGKQKLLKLVNSLKNTNTSQKFEILFKKIYKLPLSYQTFNKI